MFPPRVTINFFHFFSHCNRSQIQPIGYLQGSIQVFVFESLFLWKKESFFFYCFYCAKLQFYVYIYFIINNERSTVWSTLLGLLFTYLKKSQHISSENIDLCSLLISAQKYYKACQDWKHFDFPSIVQSMCNLPENTIY